MANTHSIAFAKASSQKASDTNTTGLNITGDATWEFWLKFASRTTTASLINGYDGSNTPYQIYATTTNLGFYYIGSGGSQAITNAWSTTNGVWYHVGVTITGTTLKFVVDGTQLGSDKTLTATRVASGTMQVHIGANAVGAQATDGRMDDVRIWNTGRTVTEINDNKSTELVGNETNLQGYWKLNNSYVDETSNGNDLTGVNSPTFPTDPAFGGGATRRYFAPGIWRAV